jgi:mono/diheme cytochrome c family protein
MKVSALVLLSMLGLVGCGSVSRTAPPEVFSDMKRQLKYQPQAESPLFEDGRAARRPVAGTVSRDALKEDDAFYTGSLDGKFVAKNPLPVNLDTLRRGQERFNVYCAACHDRTGSGRGIVALRGSWPAANLTEERIRSMPDGELFDTITHGRRTMPGYRFQIGERDRWAIAAYVRALGRAAGASLNDVPPELRGEL